MNRGLMLPTVAIAVAIVGFGVAGLLREALTPSTTGPLAIVEPEVGSSDGRTEGVLEITEECVRLVHPDGTSSRIIIWIQGAAIWNPADRSIAVQSSEGDDLNLRDGDAITLTGGGGPDATLERAGRWVRRPSDACRPSSWFLAAGVSLSRED